MMTIHRSHPSAPLRPAPVVPPLGKRLLRAVRLRCPVCGGGPLLESWLRFRPRCPRCGFRTERGEQDFFLGAMMFNLVLSEGILGVLLVGLLIFTWPEVPWTFLQFGGVALMALMPFVFYPFSKTIWMAFDLMLRPLTPEELEWHRESADDAFRPEDHR